LFVIIVCFKNYGKTPAYIVKMYKEKEMAQLMETERKRAVKPPFRYLPESERNEMLSVRARPINLNSYFLFFTLFSISTSHLLIICACVCITKSTAFADLYILMCFSLRDWRQIGLNFTRNFYCCQCSPTRYRKWKGKPCWRSNWTTWRKTSTC